MWKNYKEMSVLSVKILTLQQKNDSFPKDTISVKLLALLDQNDYLV